MPFARDAGGRLGWRAVVGSSRDRSPGMLADGCGSSRLGRRRIFGRGEGKRRRVLGAAEEVLAGERAPTAAWRAGLDGGVSRQSRPSSRHQLAESIAAPRRPPTRRRLPLLPMRQCCSSAPPRATPPSPRAPTLSSSYSSVPPSRLPATPCLAAAPDTRTTHTRARRPSLPGFLLFRRTVRNLPHARSGST
ncbi:hypothetical protein VPH35_064703 [Triticum aestivum]